MRADLSSQFASASAFAVEVSFEFHAAHYSDSLELSNSDSHIDISSVLLWNARHEDK
jgi:hypothetical protein